MRDRTEKMIGGVSVLLLLFMVTRWKLFEYAALVLWIVHLGSYLRRERKVNPVTIWYAVLTGPLDRTSGLLFTQGTEGQSCDHLVRGPWGGAYWSVYMGYSIL